MPTENQPPIRCALYIRVSTRDQRYLQQFRELRAAVEARGWSVARVYRERRSAAAGTDRPEWRRLQHDAQLRRFGAVAAASLDRIGRSALDILKAVADFRDRGIRLYLQREGLSTDDATGQLMITVLAGVAQLERDLISERTKQGMRAARHRGKAIGRPTLRIPADDLESLRSGTTTAAALARLHGVNTTTIRRRLSAHLKGGTESRYESPKKAIDRTYREPRTKTVG